MNHRLVSSSIILFLLVLAAIYPDLIHTPCNENYRHDKTLQINTASVDVEIAKTDVQLEKGLGGRSCIGSYQGMLFELGKEGHYPFWMKDMKFPIDIIWLNSQGQVIRIKPNVLPSTYPRTYINHRPAKYVLELKAGQAKKLGIEKSSVLNL